MKEFEKDWNEAEGEDEIKLLTKSKERHQMADKGLSKITKTSFNKIFNEFRRDTELLHIAKAIQHTPSSQQSQPTKPVVPKKVTEKKADDTASTIN